MGWDNWPLYVRKKHALTTAKLSASAPACSVTLEDDRSIEAKDAVDWFYGVLSTLDAKASALMRLNGVQIAAAAFLLGLFGRPKESILSTISLDKILVVYSAFASAVSIGCCLFVVNVSWKFLAKVTASGKSFEFSKEISELNRACEFRQDIYRLAWSISLVASILFLFEFLIQVVFVTMSICAGKAPWN